MILEYLNTLISQHIYAFVIDFTKLLKKVYSLLITIIIAALPLPHRLNT